ncbi:hypothetical protein P885DRAFT_72848 [Corynascus similis CBS 632.67]
MRALQSLTAALPRAFALRMFATRAAPTISTARTHRKNATEHHPNPPATSATTPLDLSPNQGVYGSDWSSHFNASSEGHHSAQPIDDRTRACYSTQIYHGQARPSNRRGIHHSAWAAAPQVQPNVGAGPATGAGTGVPIAAQMFGAEVKGNPTESEADVAADRSEDDPLPAQFHRTIRLGAGGAAPSRTESEEDVVADRGRGGDDPLAGIKKPAH